MPEVNASSISVSKKKLIPENGYSKKEEAGKKILYLAIFVSVVLILIPLLMYLIGGEEYVQWAWAQGTSPSGPIQMYIVFQVVGYMAVVMWHSITTKGVKRALLAFVCVAFVGWLNEFLGTHFGLVFGPYHYTNAMTLHLFGVPALIPPAWEMFLYPSFYLALYLLPTEFMGKSTTLKKKIITILFIALVGAFFVTCIDMIVDPIDVGLNMWVWHVNGPYLSWLDGGEPISNFAGWFLTAFEVMIVYQLILGSTPGKRHIRSKYLDVYIPFVCYAGNFIFYIVEELVFQRHFDVALIGTMSFGGVVLIILTKLYLDHNGYKPNAIATDISDEAVAKLEA